MPQNPTGNSLFVEKPTFSFEFFPPKTPEGAASLLETVERLKEFRPPS